MHRDQVSSPSGTPRVSSGPRITSQSDTALTWLQHSKDDGVDAR